MEVIRIDETEIFLDDKGDGKGKITISNTYGYNFSYFWGAMGKPLKDFLLSINEDYFVNKLANEPLAFDAKLTAKEVRKYIRVDLSYDLPWYKYMEFQKGLREWIKGIEQVESEHTFVDYCYGIMNDYRINLYELDRWEQEEVRGILENTFKQEPWNFIQKGDSDEAVFLKKLFKKLKKELKNNNHEPNTET